MSPRGKRLDPDRRKQTSKDRNPVLGLGVENKSRDHQGMRYFEQSVSDVVTVRAHSGRLSTLCVSHSRSGLYGAFVWVCRHLTVQNGGFRPGQHDMESPIATHILSHAGNPAPRVRPLTRSLSRARSRSLARSPDVSSFI
jgi:hypothetical protein